MNSNRPASYNKLSYTQKVARINRKLRTGDITRIAEATQYSVPYVSEVLSGKYSNSTIVNRGYDMTRGRISTSERLASLIG